MKEIRGNSYERWEKYRYKIGPIRRNFSVILEVVTDEAAPAVMALDNLRLVDCFNGAKRHSFSDSFIHANVTVLQDITVFPERQCSLTECIMVFRICNITCLERI
jgi:hypothetical protein